LIDADIDVTDDEHAAVTELIKRAIEEDHFPLARRLDLLCSALAKLDPAAAAALRRPMTSEAPSPPISPIPKKTAARPLRPPCGWRVNAHCYFVIWCFNVMARSLE
jgi:hypothetical protein